MFFQVFGEGREAGVFGEDFKGGEVEGGGDVGYDLLLFGGSVEDVNEEVSRGGVGDLGVALEELPVVVGVEKEGGVEEVDGVAVPIFFADLDGGVFPDGDGVEELGEFGGALDEFFGVFGEVFGSEGGGVGDAFDVHSPGEVEHVEGDVGVASSPDLVAADDDGVEGFGGFSGGAEVDGGDVFFYEAEGVSEDGLADFWDVEGEKDGGGIDFFF